MDKSPMVIFSQIVKQFGPILAMFSIGAGAYFEARMAIRDNARELQDLRGVLERFIAATDERRSFGPNGFRNPEISAALEASIRRIMEERGVRTHEFWDAFWQLNPTLIKPQGRR